MSILWKLKSSLNHACISKTIGRISFILDRQLCTIKVNEGSFVEETDIPTVIGASPGGEELTVIKEKPKKIKSIKTVPPLKERHCKNVDNVVAITLRMDNLYWVNMDRDLHVKEWSHVGIFEKVPTKFSHVKFYHKLKKAIESIPTASLYVMERDDERIQTLSMQNLYANSSMFRAMFLTMMMERPTILTEFSDEELSSHLGIESPTNYVIMMRKADISRHFDIYVGNKKTNISKTVDSILNKSNVECNDIVMPQDFVSNYRKLGKKTRYFYGDTLLLAITFMKNFIKPMSSTVSE